MTTTPRMLFDEFSALADDARAAQQYDAAAVYNIAVDWLDSQFKGVMSDQWLEIFSRLLDVAVRQAETPINDEERDAWERVTDAFRVAVILSGKYDK